MPVIRMDVASFRGLPSIEEQMKGGMRKAEAAMDSVVDSLPTKNATPEVQLSKCSGTKAESGHDCRFWCYSTMLGDTEL